MNNGLTNLKRDYVMIYYRLCFYNYNILLTQPKREIKIFSAIRLKNRWSQDQQIICVVANQRQQAYDWRTLLYLIGTLIENVMVK